MVWSKIVERINAKRTTANQTNRTAVSGPDFFGFGITEVAELIAKLPGTNKNSIKGEKKTEKKKKGNQKETRKKTEKTNQKKKRDKNCENKKRTENKSEKFEKKTSKKENTDLREKIINNLCFFQELNNVHSMADQEENKRLIKKKLKKTRKILVCFSFFVLFLFSIHFFLDTPVSLLNGFFLL